jgi:Cof subfamily protein (haloacid dehalogenase superfamily)
MNIKLIVTDLDGTLLRSDKTISDYTRDVFKRCRENGIKIAFASARSTSSIEVYSEIVPIDGFCASNGANNYADDELLVRYTFDKATQLAFTAELKALPSLYMLSAKDSEYRYSLDNYKDGVIIYDFPTDCDKDFITLQFRCKDLDAAIAILRKYDNIRYYTTTGEDLVDIIPLEATKRNAIVTLCEHWGIAPSEIAVFGDDFNDIDMLTLPGVTAVAMSNAIPEVKAVADYVCGSNDEDGVAKWVEGIIFDRRT